MNKGNSTKFIKVRGRVIPIRSKGQRNITVGERAKSGAVKGAKIGAGIGAAIGAAQTAAAVLFGRAVIDHARIFTKADKKIIKRIMVPTAAAASPLFIGPKALKYGIYGAGLGAGLKAAFGKRKEKK